MKDIDLKRSEYRVGPVKGEPLFGPGWPIGVAVLITIAIGTLAHEASGPVYFLGAIAGAVLGGIVQQFYR